MNLQVVGWGVMDWIDVGQDRDRWSSCECGNEPLGSLKFRDFLEKLWAC
jgi:hypothetical protein